MDIKCSPFSPNSTVPLCARRKTEQVTDLDSVSLSKQIYYNLPSVWTVTCVSVSQRAVRQPFFLQVNLKTAVALDVYPTLGFEADGENDSRCGLVMLSLLLYS